ncbi:MAG: response regulator [Desulfobacteraceae bacterium]|nr:response regulator [Desulfobacteraceae bacterium]
MNVEKDYYTIPEAAKICSVGRTTMWRWVKSGYLKASMTLGGQHRIQKTELESVLAERGGYSLLSPDIAPEPEFSGRSLSSGKILIVDDDPDIRKIMTRFLSAADYEVAVASDGFGAGARLMDFKPDLLVLDLVMPGMDGFEVCKRIKKNPRTSHIKILAITGYDDEENRARIMKAGADGYLAKPLKIERLLEEIKSLLAGSAEAVVSGQWSVISD